MKRMTLTLHARGGRPELVPVTSLTDASAKLRAWIEGNDYGVSDLGRGYGEVHDDGQLVARVSYNGKIWPAS